MIKKLKLVVIILFVWLLLWGTSRAVYAKTSLNDLKDVKQVVLVTTSSKSSSYTTVTAYECTEEGQWVSKKTSSGRVGENGIDPIETRKQGSKKTPQGILKVLQLYAKKSNPGALFTYHKITDNMYWNLNSGSSNYNRLVYKNPGGDYEHLIDYDTYNYLFTTDYNLNQTSKKGGAIFFHCNGAGATQGCISVPETTMKWYVKWLDPEKNPVIIVTTKNEVQKYFMPATQITKIKVSNSNSVQINWKRVYGTSRYVIQRADKENGTYKTVKTIKDPETTSWTDTTVENNKVYYYRIKTKNYLDGNVGYTATSEVKDTTVLVKSLKAKYLEKNSFTLAVKQSREIAITVSPSTATNQSLKWTSSDKSIATVNSNGKVTGKKVGKVTITAQTKDGSNQKISFTVKITKRKTGTSVNTSKTDIINIKKSKYTYTQMEKDIKALYKKYSEFLSYESLGKTYDNRKIYEVTLGNKNAKEHILIQSTIHGREYMNTLLVMRQIENYCMNYYTGTYNGKYYSELLDEVCIHIIPMMNPDGVTISQFGASGIKDATLRKKVESMQLRYGTYSKWRANARGVDLNRNYPLNWSSTSQTWISTANSDGTKGSSAGSEKETKILMNRIKTLKPSTVISYHSAGSVIYWNFHQTGTLQKKFKSLFNTIKAETGYSAQAVGSLRSCFGDWVAEVQKIPTLTIETGHTTSPSDCPLSISQFSTLWKENKYILPALALWESKN